MWGALPDPIVLDWDSTGQPKYVHQEEAKVRYSPDTLSRRSYRPLLGILVRARLCPVYRFRSGDTVTASNHGELWEFSKHELAGYVTHLAVK